MKDAASRSAMRNRAILLLGPTAAGKTPLGELIQRRGLWGMRCVHVDFGTTFREIVARDRPDEQFSREDVDFLREVLESGALLENEYFPIAERILRSCMARCHADSQTCLGLNGVPRHVGQARRIDAILDVRAVVHLGCCDETVFRRIRTNAGGDRTGRVDDDLEAVRKRLATFHERTAPLLEHYRRQGTRIETVEITADMTPQQVWDTLNER